VTVIPLQLSSYNLALATSLMSIFAKTASFIAIIGVKNAAHALSSTMDCFANLVSFFLF